MRKKWTILGVGFLWVAYAASAAEPAESTSPTVSVRAFGIVPEPSASGPYRVLRGPDARHQLVVDGEGADGSVLDLTRQVRYEVEPAGVVEVQSSGLVTPLADGKATVAVTWGEGSGMLSQQVSVEVVDFAGERPINFTNQIVPIFTKLGCNGGGCHGKSSGQNGFKLSLLGFYPLDDYEYLTREARGRRLFPAAPDHSLLLLKAANRLPHGGGQRLLPDSFEYRAIRRWIQQGMPLGKESDPHLARIEVFPGEREMTRLGEQQVAVFAHYSDGSVVDVTSVAQYEPNDTEMAEVTNGGLVKTKDLAGAFAVMVRYQGQVGVFRAIVPLGVEVTSVPASRNFIDDLVFARLKRLGMPPSEVCDDATFLRRVTLDVAGRLPTDEEARRFLASNADDKREQVIERLLESRDYAYYFAGKWNSVLRNKRVNGNYTRGNYAFHEWIRRSLYDNRPYDQFVMDILAASGGVRDNPPVVWYRSVGNTEQRVEDSAQLFLGLRIQCARCHHHPFEVWSQRDYYGFAAFFERVGKKDNRRGAKDEARIFHRRGQATARNPRTQEVLKPTGLGSDPLDLDPDHDPRLALAEWMVDPGNRFFAPALVNRYWKHFFSRGLVEPEDDMRLTNPASHPELLEALAAHFAKSGFDLKELVRTICRSHTYQLSSLPNEHNATDKQSFSRYYPKRLNAEVLYDSLMVLTGTEPAFGGLPQGTRAVQLPDSGVNNYFLTVFGRPMAESACECERSNDANLAQSLHLLNSKEVQGRLTDKNGRAARLAADSEKTAAAKIEALYFTAYGRAPQPDELKTALAHVEASENKQHGYEDIIWALLNTKEFLFNH